MERADQLKENRFYFIMFNTELPPFPKLSDMKSVKEDALRFISRNAGLPVLSSDGRFHRPYKTYKDYLSNVTRSLTETARPPTLLAFIKAWGVSRSKGRPTEKSMDSEIGEWCNDTDMLPGFIDDDFQFMYPFYNEDIIDRAMPSSSRPPQHWHNSLAVLQDPRFSLRIHDRAALILMTLVNSRAPNGGWEPGLNQRVSARDFVLKWEALPVLGVMGFFETPFKPIIHEFRCEIPKRNRLALDVASEQERKQFILECGVEHYPQTVTYTLDQYVDDWVKANVGLPTNLSIMGYFMYPLRDTHDWWKQHEKDLASAACTCGCPPLPHDRGSTAYDRFIHSLPFHSRTSAPRFPLQSQGWRCCIM